MAVAGKCNAKTVRNCTAARGSAIAVAGPAGRQVSQTAQQASAVEKAGATPKRHKRLNCGRFVGRVARLMQETEAEGLVGLVSYSR